MSGFPMYPAPMWPDWAQYPEVPVRLIFGDLNEEEPMQRNDIVAVWGPEPPRQEEVPEHYRVGEKVELIGEDWVVGRIYRKTKDGLDWLVVLDENQVKRVELNTRYVASIHYEGQ